MDDAYALRPLIAETLRTGKAPVSGARVVAKFSSDTTVKRMRRPNGVPAQ